jgi:dephospho-CoA kinase
LQPVGDIILVMKVIGVTGNIGSGKSAVCRILARLGAAIIDADELGHETYRPHSKTWQEIVAAFGKDIVRPDYEIDRAKLGRMAFSSPAALARLNEIVHPEAYRLALERIETHRRQGAELVVIEATLLIEAGWVATSPDKGRGAGEQPSPSRLVDKVWLVLAPESEVVRRLTEDRGISEAQILSRLRMQMPAEEKMRYADELIYNDGDIAHLETEVTRLWRKLNTA